jgi:hypothetical protein
MQEQWVLTQVKQHTSKRTFKQKLCLLLMGFIAIFILLRDAGGMVFSRFVFVGVATLICLLSDKSGIYSLLAFLAPLATGISCTYITAIALVILLFKRKRLKVQTLGFCCMAILLFMELLSAIRGLFSIMDYLRFIGIFLFSFLRMVDMDKDYDNAAILHSYLFGFWSAMASVLGQMLQEYSLSGFLRLGVRFGSTRQQLGIITEGMRVSYNPNELGFLCLLSALFCLLLYRKNKKKWYLLSFCGASILGIMTQSRTFILVYAMGITLYALFSCSSVKAAFRSIIALAIGSGATIRAAVWLVPEYVARFLRRFQDADITNNRIDIMEYYFHEMSRYADRLFIGVGLQNYREKYGYLMSAHNATQEVIIAWGLIGLLVVITLFVGVLHNAHVHNPKARLIQYIPFVIYLVAIQSGQGFSDTAGMLRLMVAYSAILLHLNGGTTYSTP